MGPTKLYPTLSMVASLLLASLDLKPYLPPLPPARRVRHHFELAMGPVSPNGYLPAQTAGLPLFSQTFMVCPFDFRGVERCSPAPFKLWATYSSQVAGCPMDSCTGTMCSWRWLMARE